MPDDKRAAVNTIFKSLWYDPTENRTQSASFEGEDAIRYTIELVKVSIFYHSKAIVCFFW